MGLAEGQGVIHTQPTKQCLNTKSSTEAELEAASDYIPQANWIQKFLEKQRHEIVEQDIFQDNKSLMKLAINDRRSSGLRTRHLDMRFFFIKDRLKTENVMMMYCPTHNMLADYFTKLLQGSLFK